MLIGLIRHGAHDELGRILSGRASDIDLNNAGEAEVRALADRLRAQPRTGTIARIETSPRRRTAATARIIGAVLGLAPVTVPALDEIDFGTWAGRPFADLDGDADWSAWNMRRATAPTPGGETMAAATARAMDHLHRIAGAGGDPVLCVSHCDIIRGVVAHCLGLSLDNILRFDIDTASVSWLMVDGHGQTRVLNVNAHV